MMLLAARRFGENRRDPGRRPAFHPLAAASFGIGFAAVAAPAALALRSRRQPLALAAQFLEALADRREIVGGAGAVHGGSPPVWPAVPARFAIFDAEPRRRSISSPPLASVAGARRVRLNASPS